jgi:hypothetical protein
MKQLVKSETIWFSSSFPITISKMTYQVKVEYE